MASSTVHFMLASAIRGKPLPRCWRIACTRATSEARSGRPDLHLDGAKALGKIVVGLLEQRVDGKIEVDAAGVTGHAGVEATEQTEQRQIGAARLQVPQGDIERGERQHGRSAAPAIMQAPPDVMPDRLRCRRLAGPRSVRDLPPEDVCNRAAIAADGVGIARAFSPIRIANAACHQFEGCDFAVCAVGEGNRQRDPKESSLDRFDECH
jgi:hypothetical protein